MRLYQLGSSFTPVIISLFQYKKARLYFFEVSLTLVLGLAFKLFLSSLVVTFSFSISNSLISKLGTTLLSLKINVNFLFFAYNFVKFLKLLPALCFLIKLIYLK